jgi:IS605 OrfB family transposase
VKKRRKATIALQCRLRFETQEDREAVLYLMRRFSSATRFAYQRLLEGMEGREVRQRVAALFGLNDRYAHGALTKAKAILSSCQEQGRSPKKVVFGGRRLFEQLKRRHLSGKRQAELKRAWRERRQGLLFAVGRKHDRGNQNLRLEWEGSRLFLRISVGHRRWVRAEVIRKAKREKDKWNRLLARLARAEATGEWFPYTVTLRLREGQVYAFISFEEDLPPVSVARDRGVLGIDLNAFPHHLAWAEASPDGNLLAHGAIPLTGMEGLRKAERERRLWLAAYEVIRLAKAKGKAIALERLKGIPRGQRGDGRPGLRRKLGQWAPRSLGEKIQILARREGIEVVEVSPAYTSIIGSLKYAPQFLLDKDRAAAFVIARRALGFEERLPAHYERLLQDGAFLEYATAYWMDRIAELRERLKGEKSKPKRNALRAELKRARESLRLSQSRMRVQQSVGGGTVFPCPADRGKEPVRGRASARRSGWEVVRAVLVEPILGRSFRDLSPLRPVLVSGDWKGAAMRRASDLVREWGLQGP